MKLATNFVKKPRHNRSREIPKTSTEIFPRLDKKPLKNGVIGQDKGKKAGPFFVLVSRIWLVFFPHTFVDLNGGDDRVVTGSGGGVSAPG
jgi:hypothetical protein